MVAECTDVEGGRQVSGREKGSASAGENVKATLCLRLPEAPWETVLAPQQDTRG